MGLRKKNDEEQVVEEAAAESPTEIEGGAEEAVAEALVEEADSPTENEEPVGEPELTDEEIEFNDKADFVSRGGDPAHYVQGGWHIDEDGKAVLD